MNDNIKIYAESILDTLDENFEQYADLRTHVFEEICKVLEENPFLLAIDIDYGTDRYVPLVIKCALRAYFTESNSGTIIWQEPLLRLLQSIPEMRAFALCQITQRNWVTHDPYKIEDLIEMARKLALLIGCEGYSLQAINFCFIYLAIPKEQMTKQAGYSIYKLLEEDRSLTDYIIQRTKDIDEKSEYDVVKENCQELLEMIENISDL